MAAPNQNQNNTDLFDAYFRRADLDGDGQISGAEAVGFFQGANLPKHVLAQVWMHADQKELGYLGRQEFYNALKLVTVAQSKRELTPEIVKTALYTPASARIPAPQINLAATPAPQSRVPSSIPQSSAAASVPSQNLVVGGRPGLGNASTNQQNFQSQQNQFVRPLQPAAPTGPGNVSTNQQNFQSQQNQFIRPLQAAAPTGNGNASTSQHNFQSQQNQSMRPLQAAAPTGESPTAKVAGGNIMPRGGTMVAPHPPSSNITANWSGPSPGAGPQVSNRDISSLTNQGGFGQTVSGSTFSSQPRPTAATGQTVSSAPKPQESSISSNQSVMKSNGFRSVSLFGDVFTATPAQPTQASTAVTSSTSSPALLPASGPQASAKPSSVESSLSKLTQQPVSPQYQQVQPLGKTQQVVAQSTNNFSGTGKMASSQLSQSQHPWPKMMLSDVQKYSKVFMQVDTDRDGRITGEQARNLFLSWRLPRDILKQVWDLSDQDNDSMLTLREFCTALYLMERFREGRPLPLVLPSGIIVDETLFTTSGRPAVPYGAAAWGPGQGFQQPQVMNPPRPPLPSARARPPRPTSVSQNDANIQPGPQKPKIPALEKHLVDQLSQDEQDSLNSKFKEAMEANKKVEELEKDIHESKAKIEFYRVKMQELVLYKSRCDNRLNEITERVSADKREVEALARKYEEKYKQAGDVASRLTLEESTFRDIQETKMEMYQAIVKFEAGDTAEGALQDRANHIQQGLEELVKNLSERCKQYGLRSKPSTLVELPFGWQIGIQEEAADWDEDWDKFEDEGFTFVKELTLDVQNVISPPKPKTPLDRKETASSNDVANPSSADADAKSGKIPSTTSELISEKDSENYRSENGLAKSSSDGPAENGALGNHSHDNLTAQSNGTDGSPHAMKTTGDSSPHSLKNSEANGSPHAMKFDGSLHAKGTRGDHDGAESIFSGEKSFDESSWGKFDIHHGTDSIWDENDSSKMEDLNPEKFDSNSLFGFGDFNIKPIKIQSSDTDFALPSKSAFSFDESVPSTPAYTDFPIPAKSTFNFDESVPSTPAYSDNIFQGKSSSSFADSDLFKGKSSSVFADSVPSTPAYTDNSFQAKGSSFFADSVPSTPAYADNSFQAKGSSFFADSVPSTPSYADNSFQAKGSSFFADSVPSTPAYADNLFKGSSVFADSVPSTPAYSVSNSQRGFGEGSDMHSFDSFSRYDSINMNDCSSQGPYLARFDSARSSADYDQGHGFPLSFDSFSTHDAHDGASQTHSPRTLAQFDSMRSTTSNYDHKSEFLPFDDTDPFGSTGSFRTSLETPRKDADHWRAF